MFFYLFNIKIDFLFEFFQKNFPSLLIPVERFPSIMYNAMTHKIAQAKINISTKRISNSKT